MQISIDNSLGFALTTTLNTLRTHDVLNPARVPL